MKYLLAISSLLILLAGSFVLANHQVSAIPVSYNVTNIDVPFITYTRAGFDILVEAGYNGTVTSAYQGRTSNSTLNWEFGYHPTLPTTFDTKNNITASASIAATQTISLTVGSNLNNKMVIVGITFQHNGDTNHNNARMTSVTIGGQSMTLALNKTVTCGANTCSSQIWYLGNSTLSGAQTVTITPSSVTTYHMVAGAYSLYNVRNISPIGVTNSTTNTSVKPLVSLTPTFKGSSWILDNLFSQQTTSPTGNSTQKWVGKTAVLMGASQIVTNPTISSINSLSYTTTAVQWAETAVEIIPIQNQLNWGFNLARESNSLTNIQNMVANGSKIYYFGATGTGIILQHIDTITGVETHDWTMSSPSTNCAVGNNPNLAIFPSQNRIITYCAGGAFGSKTISTGNTTSGVASTITFVDNEKVRTTGGIANGDKFSSNATGFNSDTITTNQCELTYIPSNTTTPIDNIGCDKSVPNHVTHYWDGMYLQKIGNYYTNSTLSFLSNIDAATYKKALTIPAQIYGIPDPDVRMVGHWNGADYLIAVSSTQINYESMSYLTTLFNMNRAFQGYELTLPDTDNHYYLEPSSINPSVSVKFYGPSLNVTSSKYGLVMLPSGYTMRTTTSSESVIRTVDPRWTNTPQTDIPAISTTSSLFQIILTVANAPTDAAVWLVNSAQVINNENSMWCGTQLDSTHTAECDIPLNQCPNIYIADISTSPYVYLYEGNVCANGANQKTVSYVATLPTSFYTQNYGATSSYNPTTNIVTSTVRGTAPFTYNVIIKNSTGAIAQNFTKTVNGTIDSHSFNVTNVSKSAAMYITITGVGQVYQVYLGSPLSFASVVSFFHTYFNYQGFDMLSFIPLIFASMFTRNNVNIGIALTVVCIATLSWLSIVVIPDTTIYIMIIIAAITMIGYRGYQYFG